MVTMFEPDEGVFLPVVQNMAAPKASFTQFAKDFLFYNVYSYGFPYFASSALVILPLQWFGQAESVTSIMLVLRQLISVLPMLLGILLLVFIQDGFRTYRSIGLVVILLVLPSSLQNGFWWHPDGIVLFLSSLVLYLLWKDERQIGRHFYMAAMVCGVLTATKVVGVYFFLAIGMTLLWSLSEKKITIQQGLRAGLLFVGLMAAAFVISNPYLLFKTRRIDYFETMLRETSELSQGYGVVYEKGIAAAWPVIRSYYGQCYFLCLALAATIWGLFQKHSRFFSALTLAWLIPLTFSVLFVTHFKYQYWLPVAVPFISNIILFFPVKKGDFPKHKLVLIMQYGAIGLIFLQFILFIQQDATVYLARVSRQENNPRVSFYEQAQVVLKPFDLKNTNIFYDYRLYVPSTPGWSMSTSHGIVTYDVMNVGNFDFLFLLESRMRDYLETSAQGVDPAELSKGKSFYQDAMLGKITGYIQLYSNETARLFVLESTCLEVLGAEKCAAMTAAD